MGWLDTIAQRNQQLGGAVAPTQTTAPEASPLAPAPEAPDYAKLAKERIGFTGWNADNFGQYDSIIAQAKPAEVRDYVQTEFNSFYEPLAAKYREQMAARGTPADATDLNLMKSAELQEFARTGQLPAQSLTQQWLQQPAPTGGSTGTTPPPVAAEDPRRNALYEEIMRRYRDNDGPVGRDNSIIRSQADAFSAQQTREMRDYLADLAESEGPNANLRGEQRMAQERAGRESGAFEAELMAREQARRGGIQQSSLDSATRLLDVDSQQALARELGLSDLELRRMQLGQSNDQFLRELALREWDLLNRNDILRRGL